MRAVPHPRWLAVALLLLIAGTTVSWLAARTIAHHAAETSEAKLHATATQVAATIKLDLRREEELLVAARAFVRAAPAADPAAFRRWAADVGALARHPELIGLARIALVPAAQVGAYARRVTRATPRGDAPAPFVILPPGSRASYCFMPALVSTTSSPPGGDLCPSAPSLYRSRDTGATQAYPVQLADGTQAVGEALPVYRRGAPLRTVAQRRAAFVGWVGLAVQPRALLAQARAGRRDVRVVLQRGTASGLAFAAGHAPRGAAAVTVDLNDGSWVRVSQRVADTAIAHDHQALAALGGGMLVFVLLALLVLVLSTGRARALRLVEEKTGQLIHQALHDGLTGLPNRALVLDRAEQALARARRTRSPVAALFIDIDGFKGVNDGYGHAAGDELLRVVAARLHTAMRAADTVGRLGGDEFVVLLEADDTWVAPKLVAERLIAVLRQPIEVEVGTEAVVSASIGIAVGERDTADELLRDADLALYAAKEAGKNRFVFFDDSMHAAAADRTALERGLQTALAHDELFVLYQPTFDLDSGLASGVEALVRWAHPTRGVISSGQFIPIAEQTALIVDIGNWVLDQACAQVAAWREEGYRISMSVNVSVRQLEYDGFVDHVADVLEAHDIVPGMLTLEITESALMRDPEASAAHVTALKRLGVRIAIDDFGTGYSSLAYLRQFPVDALKIDRSFISGISASRESAALMHTLVQLGKTLGLETLGEGIEDDAQLAHLRREGCDRGQGFLFARPLTPHAIREFFERADVGGRAR